MDQRERPGTAPDGPSMAPVLQPGRIADLCEEGTELLFSLIDLFLAETPTRLTQLTTALEAGDRATVERAAHTLKSTAAVFGAETMQALAAGLERAARAGQLEEVGRSLEALRTATVEVERALLAEREIRAEPAN